MSVSDGLPRRSLLSHTDIQTRRTSRHPLHARPDIRIFLLPTKMRFLCAAVLVIELKIEKRDDGQQMSE